MGPSSPNTTGIDARSYWEQDRLLDGRSVLLRAIRPEDKGILRAGFRRLSERSIYQRFFHAKRELSEEELRYLTELDFENHVALLAVLEEHGSESTVGVGRYIVEPGTPSAEIAFVVDETHHGLGVATLLLRHLSKIARSKGVERFRAFVLFDNRAMVEVFEHSGLPIKKHLAGNVLEITLELN